MTKSDDAGFAHWMAEVARLTETPYANYREGAACAKKALAVARGDAEWAEAQYAWGRVQCWTHNWQDGLATFEAIVERLREAAGERVWLAKALNWKAYALGNLKRRRDALVVCDEIVYRLGAASELAVREEVAAALEHKARTLSELDRPRKQVIAAYDQIIVLFGAAPELPLRKRVASALFWKGLELGRDTEAALAAHDEVVARYGGAAEATLRVAVARALEAKGEVLRNLGRNEAAIATYDTVVARFGSASELALRHAAASALVEKGRLLADLGRREEAIASFDEVATRFDSAPDKTEDTSFGITRMSLGQAVSIARALSERIRSGG